MTGVAAPQNLADPLSWFIVNATYQKLTLGSENQI